MDFKGQMLSEQLCMYTIILFGIIGFLAGYIMASFKITMIIYTAGVILAFVISVPDWRYFNQNPLDWLPSEEEAAVVPAKKKGSRK
mmetsp:Transcript_64475/g.203638  ORF Transcript_64475/g.203638 Transcript_64475/m.203638 type:complete len:86 (-) Transcript_64475:58-315(-)